MDPDQQVLNLNRTSLADQSDMSVFSDGRFQNNTRQSLNPSWTGLAEDLLRLFSKSCLYSTN